MRLSTRAAASGLLSLLFLVVYGGCNWISAHRPDVGTFYFAWERHLPFVAWAIVPYMSIDLFFIAAPFICRTDAELRALRNRITFAVLAAGACFLIMPLRFAFERPQVGGWLGVIFNGFRTLDQPYNLVPSLHIALCLILAAHYARHWRGILGVLAQVWFGLIFLSAVFTYQHHVTDVIGGALLAGYCLYLFDEGRLNLPVLPNRRVGTYYAGGALLLGLGACALRPWGLLLLWPAASLGIVAAAYFGLGPGVYRKRDGRLPLTALLVLGPCLVGQHMSLCYYRRRCRPWDNVNTHVWIGRKLSAREAAEAVRMGVKAVLDLTSDFSEASPFLKVRYFNLPILDLTAPAQEQLKAMADFITENSERGVLYVHCKIGYSRSAAAVGAYLLAQDKTLGAQEAVSRLRSIRPSIIVRPEVIAALDRFARARQPEAGQGCQTADR